MSLTISADPVPLRADRDDVIRVGQTRVPLDTVIAVFELGATPEEIVQQFPVLHLADVYAVVGYYLRHREEIGTYLRERRDHSEASQRAAESRYEAAGIRERLLRRRAERG